MSDKSDFFDESTENRWNLTIIVQGTTIISLPHIMSRKERILARPYNTSNNYKKKRYMFLRYKLLRMQQILVEEVTVLTPNRTPARVEATS